MRKILLIYAVVATLLLGVCCAMWRHAHGETKRLHNNCEALATETKLYQTKLDESAASVVAMQLEMEEYRKQHARDRERIRALGVRLRRVESVATAASKSEVRFVAPRYDTVVVRDIVRDTLSLFRWSDSWVTLEGVLRGEEVECHIESIDTLRQVVHRVPHRWWFIRYGTKAIRQEIVSSNPHTRIVYADYIELPKRHKKR